jgi:hypothetical protein
VQRHTSTAQVIASTNNKLINKMPRGAFITMFYAIYDSHTKVLRFTQAGHPQGLILRAATKEIIPLATDGKLVGVFKNDKTGFGEEKISMQTGDKLMSIIHNFTSGLKLIRMVYNVMFYTPDWYSVNLALIRGRSNVRILSNG